MDRYQKNLAKTLELIDVCFNLKQAYLKKQCPEASQQDIKGMIYKGILLRKKRQWKLPKASLKP
jgi:hypothetical protein